MRNLDCALSNSDCERIFCCIKSRVAFQVAFGLLPRGGGLIQARLNFVRVQQDELFAGLHQLAGHDEHLLDAPADFRLDDRAQFRAHRADDILGGGARLALDRLNADSGGRQFRLSLFRGFVTAGEKRNRRDER